MRIQELEGVEFHCLSVSRLSDIFFNASSCRIGCFRFRCPTKVGMSECKVFEGKYYPEQNAVERRRGDFLQNRRHQPCSSVASPELPLRLNGNDQRMRYSEDRIEMEVNGKETDSDEKVKNLIACHTIR